MSERITVSKSAIRDVVGNPVAYYVTFAKVAGDVCAGILISQLYYWDGKGRDPDGWIYKTQDELYEETGLTRRNQETARRRLKDLDILEEKRIGLPARMYYRINTARLFELIDELPDDEQNEPDPPDQNVGKRHTAKSEPNNHSISTKSTSENTSNAASAAAPNPLAALKEMWLELQPGQNVNHARAGKDLKQLVTSGITPEELKEEDTWLRCDPFWNGKTIYPSSYYTKLDEFRQFKVKGVPPVRGAPSKLDQSFAAVDNVFARIRAGGLAL